MPDGLSWKLLLAAAVGYLLGSIPFGLLLTRLSGKGDIRDIGSGNIGTTNVLRTGSRPLAAITLAGDVLKGTIAVLIGAAVGEFTALVAGFAAFLGHLFPIWLKFHGGKGAATFLGVLAGLNWWLAVVFAAVWLISAAITRYSSASALAASAVAALVLIFLGPATTAIGVSLMALILWVRHRDNIRRLLAGTESRIGRSA
ncbi:MAG: glycerol-3-phosphate 1-O-acyltransferase PlsY [Alphaproteobacteria bacterium]